MLHGSGSTRASLESQTGFERAWNVAETLLFGLIGLTIAAGAVGLLGGGALLHAEASLGPGGDRLGYDRVLRRTATSAITLALASPAATVPVTLTGDLAAEVSATRPAAAVVHAGAGATVFTFAAEPGQAVRLALVLKPSEAGLVRGTVTVGEASLEIAQLVLP